MADKSIFSLDIETATFDRFKKDFDDYTKGLSGTVSAWKAAAKQINDAKDTVKNLNQMTRSTTTATQALTGATKSYASAVASALGYWTRTATQVNKIAGDIQRAASVVQAMRSGGGGLGLPPPPRLPPPPPTQPPSGGSSGAGTGGGVTGGGSGAGQGGGGSGGGGPAGALNNAANQLNRVSSALTRNVFGTGGAGAGHVGGMAEELGGLVKKIHTPIEAALTAMGIVAGGLIAAPFAVAPGVAALRRQGLGLGGVGVNELRAAGVASSWLNDPSGILGNLVTARRDITSPQRLAMINLFGGRADEVLARSRNAPGAAMFQGLREARRQLMGYSEETRDTMADTLGYSGMFGAGNLRAVQSMSDAEIAAHQASWENVAKKTATTPQEDRAWFDFYDKMQQTGQILEATIVKKLAPLQQPLEGLMDAFEKAAEDPAISEMIKSFADAIGKVKAEDIIGVVHDVATNLRDMYTALGTVISAVNTAGTAINTMNTAASNFGTWLHDKLGIGTAEAAAGKAFQDAAKGYGWQAPDAKDIKFGDYNPGLLKPKVGDLPNRGLLETLFPTLFGGGGGDIKFPALDQFKATTDDPALKAWAASRPSPDATEKSFDLGGSGTGFHVPGTDEVVDEQKKTNELLSDIKDSMDKATELEGPGRGTLGAGGVGGDTGTPGAGGGPGRAAGGKPGYQPGAGGAAGVDYSATTLPFSKSEYKSLTQGVADLESQGKYDIAGGAGGHYLGRYQMGAREIAESAKELGLTPPTPDEFRKNPQLQEKLYERYTLDHYNEMMKDPAFRDAPRAKQLQALGAAQLGVPAGLKWLHGSETSDAWGTPTSRWAGSVARREKEFGMGGVAMDTSTSGGFAAPMKGGKGFGSALGTDIGAHITDPKTANLIDGYLREAGVPINAHTQAWCAAWVNAQLAHEGIMGSQSNLASSFNQWGKAEKALMAHRGDIMVAADAHHVGRFTGRTRQGAGGQTQYEMESGNTGHGVGLQWVSEGEYNFRGLGEGGGGGGDASATVNNAASTPPSRSRRKHAAARPQGDDQQAMAISNPLGMGNWQLMPKTDLAIHNRTGSDVFIGASIMAG